MFTKTTVPPVSIRQGKLQPSKRYDDVAAKSKAMKTNWRLGIDKAPYESTMHASQVMVARVPPEELALTQPRILKNSSNKEAIEGGLGGRYRDPRVLYSTTQSGDFCSEHSSMSKDYVRGKPAFDRLNANKTNYDLATSDSHYDLRTTSHAHHADPKTWEVHRGFEQPVVGGWTKANGAYCVDEASRGSVLRGGGGGEGALGVQFDILTNSARPNARANVQLRTGARVSCNVKDPWRMGGNQYGELPGGTADIITGKIRPPPPVPARPTAADLRRPDADLLRTRPW